MKFSIALLFLLTFTSAASADLWCADLLGNYFFTPHRGKPSFAFSHPVYELGDGGFGTVYRVTTPNQPSVVFKDYKDPQEGFAQFDSKNLKLLSETNSNDSKVRAAKVLNVSSSSRVYLEDVLGQPLDELFNAPESEISAELKWQLYLRYMNYIKRVEKYFNTHPLLNKFNSVVSRISLPTNKIQGQPIPILKVTVYQHNIYITLKPENIIVDAKTLEMIVVDPN